MGEGTGWGREGQDGGEESKAEIGGEESKAEIGGEESKAGIGGEESKAEIGGEESKAEIGGLASRDRGPVRGRGRPQNTYPPVTCGTTTANARYARSFSSTAESRAHPICTGAWGPQVGVTVAAPNG